MYYTFCIYFGLIFVVSTCHKAFGDVNKEKSTILQNKYGEVILTEDGPPPPVCKKNALFIWCLPPDYNKNIEPWMHHTLTNFTLPFYIDFSFNIFDVQEIHDNDRTLKIDMNFGLSWKEPRLQINITAVDEYRGSNIDGFKVPISINYLDYFWFPDLEIFGLSGIESPSIRKPMASLKVNSDKVLRYNSRVRAVLSCEMNFDLYPFDSHECVLRLTSFSHHQDIVNCTSKFIYYHEHQRSLEYKIKMNDLTSHQRSFTYYGNDWRACGFRIFLERDLTQFVLKVYFTSTICVMSTWGSFIVNPSSIAERMGIIVTVFIGLIFILIGIKSSSPTSTGLNAVDLFLVVCIGYVFAAWFESVCVALLHRQTNVSANLVPACSKQVTLESKNGTSSTTDLNGFGRRKVSSSNDERALKIQTLDQINPRSIIDSISLILFPVTFAIFCTSYSIIYVK